MGIKEMQQAVSIRADSTFRIVNNVAKVERIIALILTFTPLILYATDFGFEREFRTSISDYAFMCDSYWFGSLLALAGALFIFNGAQHMRSRHWEAQQLEQLKHNKNSSFDKYSFINPYKRFGRGYNIIFGLALFGVIYFDHINHCVVHFIFAGIFYIGCALAMIFMGEKSWKTLGKVLGILTIFALILHFILEALLPEGENAFTLLWAEWVGLFFIAIYFIFESLERDGREKAVALQTGRKSIP